eukprot:364171-Chlamydomonas_euryale.AAC.3
MSDASEAATIKLAGFGLAATLPAAAMHDSAGQLVAAAGRTSQLSDPVRGARVGGNDAGWCG